MSAYLLIKTIHILLAIVAVGFNASYGIWVRRAAAAPEHAAYSLRGIKLMDDRFANPAYGLLLLSGLAMIFVGHLNLTTTHWLGASIALWVILIVVGGAGFTRTLRAQIDTLEAEGPDSPRYRRLARRSGILGGVVGLIVLVILFLMVNKPSF